MRFRLLDKVTEILIAYNRRKCQAVFVVRVRVKKRVKKTRVMKYRRFILRLCVRFDKRVLQAVIIIVLRDATRA